MVRLDALDHTITKMPFGAGKPAERMRKMRATKQKTTMPDERRMIAWDGEGIKPDGSNLPQNYVLFGCSARPDEPLVTTRPDQTLQFRELADYMLETAAMFPGAFHIGYYFKYDQNMIIRTLRWHHKIELYDKGSVRLRYGKVTYLLSWVPGKKTSITRWGIGDRAYIRIEDMAAFYASSFVKAYESTFSNAHDDETWQKVIEGKANRALTKWEDMPLIREYWYYEILAVERLAERFKRMLWDNGFHLQQWYGPGAFANYLRRAENLAEHEHGGKEDNLEPAVHEAIKCAYYGGHFEQYQAGQIQGPIYQYDINSAYPAAFCTLPTMREGGFWQKLPYTQIEDDARNPSSPLTVYYVTFVSRTRKRAVHLPMPLPYRDERGNVSYSTNHEGWYWSPEVSAIVNSERWSCMGIYITQAYRWIAATDEMPWARVIESMYETRLALKAANDPAQMVYKLGPNSLYGKMAQRVGGKKNPDTDEIIGPPNAHTLCIAGYLTSWCRGMILRIMDTMDTDQIIAVETDGIYSTAPPEQITERWTGVKFSKALGEWGMDVYDEIVYIQNGVYICRVGDVWATKTRGINKALLPPDKVLAYVTTCLPRESWAPLLIDGGEDFLTLGTAIQRCKQPDGTFIAAKANRLHCVWYPSEKIVDAAGSKRSKRIHRGGDCPACLEGKTLAEGSHRLLINQRLSSKRPVSAPYRLPWETTEVEQWRDAMVSNTVEHIGEQ